MGTTLDKLPPAVREGKPGTLLPVASESSAALYLRESPWGMRKYPRSSGFEVRLGVLDDGGVLVAALLVRVNKSDATTFEHIINTADPAGVRLLQGLSNIEMVDLHIVADGEEFSLRTRNRTRETAERLLGDLRTRPAWAACDFARVRDRLVTLYPSATALWWAAEARAAAP